VPLDYWTYLGFAVLLVLAPGPDFAVVTKNCLAYGRQGRRPGLATSFGVVSSLLIQGGAAALGVAAIIVRSATAFTVLKVVGAAYLGYLGVQALRAALNRRREPGAVAPEQAGAAAVTVDARVLARTFRQGFLSNITNPKVLAFYLSLLPQFVDPDRAVVPQVLILALTHAVLALLWLLVVVFVLDRLRRIMQRPRVRRTLEGLTGLALVGFGIRLATAVRP
jgi:RhtB (resistance to homoserine/threonine) family protein